MGVYGYNDWRGNYRDLSYKIEQYMEREGLSEKEAKERVAWEANEGHRRAKLHKAVSSMHNAGYTLSEVVDFVEKVW